MAICLKNERLIIPSSIPSGWSKLIKDCWNNQFNDRPTFKLLFQYFQNEIQLNQNIKNEKELEKVTIINLKLKLIFLL
jgi:hypothetical protein